MARIAEHDRESLNRWTTGHEFSQRFHWWNVIAELAIVLEPLAYSAVFHEMRLRSLETEEMVEARRARYADLCRPLLRGLTVAQLNDIRGRLCRDAELLDENTTLHVLLRLMATQERKRLRGQIGGCMLLWCMAEMIRRPAERELAVRLPEEDEVGHQWFEGGREGYTARRASLTVSGILGADLEPAWTRSRRKGALSTLKETLRSVR